jgi:hypothetical protein
LRVLTSGSPSMIVPHHSCWLALSIVITTLWPSSSVHVPIVCFCKERTPAVITGWLTVSTKIPKQTAKYSRSQRKKNLRKCVRERQREKEEQQGNERKIESIRGIQ